MELCDNIDKAIWRCEKNMHETAGEGLDLSSKIGAVPRFFGSMLGWLFPTEKHRVVLGWLIIVALVAAVSMDAHSSLPRRRKLSTSRRPRCLQDNLTHASGFSC
jgi:hypothetical protein